MSKKKYRSQCTVERDGRVAGLRHHAHGRNVVPPKDAHRRIAVIAAFFAALALGAALAVEKALHIRQEAHELVVVALVKAATVAGVFVDLLAPGRCIAHLAQHVPRAVVRGLGIGRRHQPQGPEQGLPEMLHGGR
jgi:hypothetical protein